MSLFLHELVRTVGARTDEYLDSVAEHQGRSAAGAGRGNTLLGVFRVLEASGDAPQGVNVWRWGDWPDAAAILARQFEPRTQDPALKRWWLGNLELRRGGLDRLIESTPATPDVAELRGAAPNATVFLHEILELERGARAAWLAAFDGEGRAALGAAGATTTAAFRSVLRDDEAVTLVGFSSPGALAAFAAAWHDAGGALGRWRARSSTAVRERHALVLRARHFLSSPWHR